MRPPLGDEPMGKTSITLQVAQIRWLKKQAAHNDCSVSEIVRHLIQQAQQSARHTQRSK